MTFIASDANLLVEDDRVLRLLTVGLLEEADYSVFDAKNAEDAWGIFQDQWPVIDLLITAVVMPGMKGFDLAFCARELNLDLCVVIEVQAGDDLRVAGEATELGRYGQPVSEAAVHQCLRARLRSLLG